MIIHKKQESMLPLKRIFCNARHMQPVVRAMSGKAGPLVDLSVDSEGIAVLTMQRAPVNSLNLDLLDEMKKALDDVAKNKPKGLVLTSASPTVFSAGLDITEMYKPDWNRAEIFWTTLQDVWAKLYGFPYPTAAAVNGHAPAGGCLLAMSCEYRAMVSGRYTTGLNETALDMIAPKWFMDTMTHIISPKEAEYALTSGKLFTVDEALKIGMIDEVASDKTDAIEKCKKFIKKFDNVSARARALTKKKTREAPLTWLANNRKEDTREFLDNLRNPQVQESIGKYLQMLKQKTAN